jgi:hypothetical protein
MHFQDKMSFLKLYECNDLLVDKYKMHLAHLLMNFNVTKILFYLVSFNYIITFKTRQRSEFIILN